MGVEELENESKREKWKQIVDLKSQKKEVNGWFIQNEVKINW